MAEPLKMHRGIAAMINLDNIDTDQIIPSREMKTVSRTGLGEGLFAGWRYTAPGGRAPNPDFILNRPEQAGTSILIAGENFGCGSSREHAVWALAEYGIRVVIARSFGEIFYGNCFQNGVLPIVLEPEKHAALLRVTDAPEMQVDLTEQRVTCSQLPEWSAAFQIGAYPKRLLMDGLDPIRMTLQQTAQISAFFEADMAARPWVYDAS